MSEFSPQTPEPISIAIPRYFERTPEDLAAKELAIYGPLFAIGITASKCVFKEHIIMDDSLERLAQLQDNPAIIAPVHRDDTDIPAVGVALQKAGVMPARYVMKAELAHTRPAAWALGHLGGIPVDRDRFDGAAQKTVGGLITHSIREGRSAVLFPEGKRMSGDTIGETKKGTAAYAFANGVPIVPVGIAGTERGFKDLKKGRRHQVAVVVGEPIEPTRKFGPVTDELRKQMQRNFDFARYLLRHHISF